MSESNQSGMSNEAADIFARGLFFLANVFHHWMVAVGLFNRITINSYGASSRLARKPPGAAVRSLLFASLMVRKICGHLVRSRVGQLIEGC